MELLLFFWLALILLVPPRPRRISIVLPTSGGDPNPFQDE